MSNKEPHFTGEETIASILALLPEASEILQANDLACTSCSVSQYESLKGGVLGHGKSEKFFQELLKEINTLAKEKKISPKDKNKYRAPQLTDLAVQKVKEFQEEMDMVDSGFKIEIVEQNNTETTYFLDFQYEPDENDSVFFSKNIPLFIPQDSQKQLEHCVIDFVIHESMQGFKVLTPQELRESHGCL